jgi:hypothetical protein
MDFAIALRVANGIGTRVTRTKSTLLSRFFVEIG